MKSKPSTILAKLMLALTALLVSFLLAEAASRYRLSRKTPPGMVFDETLVFRCAPYSQTFGRPLNDNGDIGPDVHVPKKEGERRIFLLGGSTSHSTSYVAAVQSELDTLDPNGHYTVVSSGKPRYTSYNNLQNVTSHLHRLEPDVFVHYLGVNDCIYNCFPNIGSKADVGYWNYRSWKTSIFLTLFKYALIDKQIRLDPNWVGQPIRSPYLLEKHLRELIEFSQQRAIRVVLSTFVLSYPTEDPVLRERIFGMEDTMKHFWGTVDSTVYGVAAHNRVLRRLAEEYGLPLAEITTNDIPATTEYFQDICHMTDAGRRLRGQLIARAVAEAFADSN